MAGARCRALLAAAAAVGYALAASAAHAQFTFSNYAEVRVGKDPDDPFPNVPESRVTRFDQFNLDYFQDNLRLGLRFETYVPSDDRSLEFSRFTHRYAEWISPTLEGRVGNYEALFGRGLVLRAFELTGVVREEVGTPQFGDSRDLDGIKVRWHDPRFEIVALNGKPRFQDDPPTVDRRGSVTGAMGTARPLRGVRVGGEYVRLDSQSPDAFSPPGNTAELTGGFVQLHLDPWLRRAGIDRVSFDTWVEAARATGLDIPPASSSIHVDPDEGRALYVSQNLFLGEIVPGLRTGFTWEYKDYQNFEFQVNEPPQLVREHAYALLNRNTHVVQARQEEGYQFESRWQYRRWADLVLNWSRAENRDSKRFEEFYAELTGHWKHAKWSVFNGDSQDASDNLFDRETWGTYALVPFLDAHSLELEYEQMTAERRVGSDRFDFKDNYVALTYALAGRFSLTAIRQTTNDPFDAEDPVTGEITRRAFESLSASVRVGDHHELLGFWGRRRGGLACTAGTCYLVRAFDGVILQLISRF